MALGAGRHLTESKPGRGATCLVGGESVRNLFRGSKAVPRQPLANARWNLAIGIDAPSHSDERQLALFRDAIEMCRRHHAFHRTMEAYKYDRRRLPRTRVCMRRAASKNRCHEGNGAWIEGGIENSLASTG